MNDVPVTRQANNPVPFCQFAAFPPRCGIIIHGRPRRVARRESNPVFRSRKALCRFCGKGLSQWLNCRIVPIKHYAGFQLTGISMYSSMKETEICFSQEIMQTKCFRRKESAIASSKSIFCLS